MSAASPRLDGKHCTIDRPTKEFLVGKTYHSQNIKILLHSISQENSSFNAF